MRRLILLALLLPTITAGAFWLVLPSAYRVSETTDYTTFYEPVARRILAGEGITTESGAAALRTPPGYPIILAGVMRASHATRIPEPIALDVLALICVAISSLFLHLIARGIWEGWMALVPCLGWSTYPLALWLTKQPNSELVFTPVLFAAAFALWKATRDDVPHRGRLLSLGALLGTAMLIRPIALFLPVMAAGVVVGCTPAWTRRQRAVGAALVLTASAIIVLPWEVHAARAAGRFVLLADTGVPAMRDGLTFGVNSQKEYRAGIYIPDVVRTVMIAFYAQYDQLTSFGAIMRAAAAQTVQHPLGMAGLIAMKLVRAWYGTDSQRLDRYIAAIQLVYLAILAWGWRVAWRAGGERRRLAIIVASTLLVFWCMSVLALPLVRYMVPAIGLAFALLPAAREKVVR